MGILAPGVTIWINNNLGTLLASIAASIFAWYQYKINKRQIEINLALKYQEHFIRIQNLLMKIRYDVNLVTNRGEIAINNNLMLWEKILSDLNIIYSEAQLLCDDEIEKINLEFFNNIMTIRNEMAICVSIEELPSTQYEGSKQIIEQAWAQVTLSVSPSIGTPIGDLTVSQKLLTLYRKRTQQLSLQ